jgi:hypothetical protein
MNNTGLQESAAASEDDRLHTTVCARLEEAELTEDVGTRYLRIKGAYTPADVARPAHRAEAHEVDRLPLPGQCASGFFAFAACVLVATLLTAQKQSDSRPNTGPVLHGGPTSNVAQTPPRIANISSADVRKSAGPGSGGVMHASNKERETTSAGAAVPVLNFDSPSFDTSERAVAAVFIVRRTQGVEGRAFAQWAVRSGSADAGIDFSDASGTARFEVGQQQLAIYVPIRNDLLSEENETFEVCLHSARQASIGEGSCSEATIRDDDSVFAR